jgi:glucosamine-6-phosphate deaminase
MKVLILSDEDRAVSRAARLMADHVAKNPTTVLGLATGGTMVSLYNEVVALSVREKLSFKKVTTFNLDEYVGLAPEHLGSYHTYMYNFLFSRIDLDSTLTHLPRGDTPDSDAEAARYENDIKAKGGIDLQLLGIGENGHIGFNEPSSSLASQTRVKTLTKTTVRANTRYFDGAKEMPRLAITMGVGTILESRECLVLATGTHKSSAVAAMIEGAVSASCPASALQFHRKVTVVLDDQAASSLKHREYYETVHPQGTSDVGF